MKFKNLLSLKSLLLLSFTVLVIPLFVGVFYAANALSKLSESDRMMNIQIFQQTKALGLVLQKVSDTERKAKLFVLLSDPALRQPYDRESYETARNAFQQAINALLQLPVDNKIALLANELSEKEHLIYQQIIGSESENNFKLPIDEAFLGLREASNTLSRKFELQVEQTLNDSRLSSESLEKQLLFKGTILLLTASSLVSILIWMLSRSIRQIETAIRRLTSNDLQDPINIDGPCDMQSLGKQLEWIRTHLLWLASSKQQWLQNLAREIEPVLRSIKTNTEVLATASIQQEQPATPEIFQQLTTSLGRLESVAEQLLIYSELQKNQLTNHQQFIEIDVEDMLETIIDDYQSALQNKSIIIDRIINPVQITGNPKQVHSLFEQVIANAIRFSPEHGEIRISLRCVDGQMAFEIEDEGPGIVKDKRDQVFEPFYSDDSNYKNQPNDYSGMGLTWVREYVAQHQGKVSFIDPNPDHQGAHLYLQIPMDIQA